ncbi:MAG TPA: NAD(P)H-hydrate dehydratase [Chthoniobacterales bacterium]|nr:NAD(P)H-hydrate dehydratase [Chthoniobacterales bacterium]
MTPAQMRAAEAAAFARGISAAGLMEEAGGGIARSIAKFFPRPGRCIVFAGKGHNAGDAFVAARWLGQAGWEIETRLTYPEKELNALTNEKLRECGRSVCAPMARSSSLIVLDGLLGLGAHPPLREPIRSACREINSLGKEGAWVFAIDLPSGLDGDSGATDDDCVVADFTITIGGAKSGLLADSAIDFVGRLEVVPLAELRSDGLPLLQPELAIPESLRGLLPRRKYSAYKNQFGRIGIVAGSRGFTGAAVMCSLGALRAGAGLVELFVPEEIYEIVAAAAAPEVMVKPVKSYVDLLDEPIDVWAVGPGLGQSRADEIRALICDAPQPMVIDADGLNILAKEIGTLSNVRGPRLLTPHPGEMKRLFPAEKISRAETAIKFCAKYAVTLLLKGSRTIVGEAGRPLSFNTTGNPGMATGGMGDVLTGVCGALLGAKLAPYDAARLGAWLCGRAAELAIFNGEASEESLLPRDVIERLGLAFTDLRTSSR